MAITSLRRCAQIGLLLIAFQSAASEPVSSAPVIVKTDGLPEVTIEWELLQTPTGSMEPTLLPKQYLLAKPIRLEAKGVTRGNIIAFDVTEFSPNGYKREPNKPTLTLINRVIGLPGDRIEIKTGQVFVNDAEISEPYADLVNHPWIVGKSYPVYTVPSGSIYVLADNRGNSIDSRICGPLPITFIRSIVKYVSMQKASPGLADKWRPL